jgi:hypothetical protein
MKKKIPTSCKLGTPTPQVETAILDRNKIVSELTKSPHGNLSAYVPIGKQAASEDPDFLAHLIAWNYYKGQIRDSKVALPVLALTQKGIDYEHKDNALAHIASLGPREFLRAYRFARELQVPGRRAVRDLAAPYIRKIESNPLNFDRVALQHRATMVELYALTHTKPCERAQQILFERKYPADSIFQALKDLPAMSPAEAAGTILERNLPFQQALGALGPKIKDTNLLLALIKRMTPTQLVTNAKMLERYGAAKDPALKAAMRAGLEKAAKSGNNVLKTTKAAEAIEDEQLKEQFREVQNKQLSKFTIDGNWLILADMSGSMQNSVEVSKQVAAILTASVKGSVYLVFFNSMPYPYDVTGKTLNQIEYLTRHIKSGGGTNIASGLDLALSRGWDIQGIAVISDGEDAYAKDRFVKLYNNEKFAQVPVYFYKVRGGQDTFSDIVPMNIFDLTGGVDYYSLPNIVKTMRVNRYSLIDEIMETPLKTLDKLRGRLVQ